MPLVSIPVAGHPAPAVPRSVRLAGRCFLIVAAVLVQYLIVAALEKGLSWRDWKPVVGVLFSLYLSTALRSGERDARTPALWVGEYAITQSGGFLVYGLIKLPLLEAAHAGMLLPVHVAMLGPAAILVAASTAVVLLLRRESKEYFRPPG